MRHSPFLPTPALPPGRKVRLRLSPHFSAFRQPFGLKHNRYVPPTMPAAWGSLVKSGVVGNANGGALTPAPFGRPQSERPTCRARPVSARVRHRPDSAIGHARFIAGEPPDPVPLVRKLQASGRRSSASSVRPTLPPEPSRKSAETFFAPAPDLRSLRFARQWSTVGSPSVDP